MPRGAREHIWLLQLEFEVDQSRSQLSSRNGIEAGKPRDGFVMAIQQCGLVLATQFPSGGFKRDELPNKLLVLCDGAPRAECHSGAYSSDGVTSL